MMSADLTSDDLKQDGGQYGGNLVFYWLYLEFYETWRPNVGVNFMVFGVNESKDVIRFNIIGRSENKMAANMAEIWNYSGYNLSSITARDPMLVST